MVLQTVTHSINLNGINLKGINLNGLYIISYNTDDNKYIIYGIDRDNQKYEIYFDYKDIISIPVIKEPVDRFNLHKLNIVDGGLNKKRYNKSLKRRKISYKKRYNRSLKRRKTKINKRK